MATTFERTWQMSFNTAMDSTNTTQCAKNVAWQLKGIIKGDVTLKDSANATVASPTGLWTCLGSSDATTAALDGSDRWLTTYTVSKLTANTAGNAHSWITLKSPNNFGVTGTNLYLTIDMTGTPTMDFYLSKTAPTGGSTTARPSAADEMTYSISVIAAGATNVKAHGGISTNGDWYFLESGNGTALFQFQMALLNLLEAKSLDGFPFVWFGSNGTTQSNGCFSRSIVAATAPTAVQTRDRSNLTTTTVSCATWYPGGGTTPIFSTMATTDSETSNYDALPIYVVTARVGMATIKGRLPDFWWAPESLGACSYEPTTNPVSCVAGQMWVPCPGVVPSV